VAVIKSKQRNCLQVESDLVLAFSNVYPRIEKLMGGNKTHVSTEKCISEFFYCLRAKFEFWFEMCVCVCVHPGWLHVNTCQVVRGIWSCFGVVSRRKNLKSTDIGHTCVVATLTPCVHIRGAKGIV
jgi:hypothetical protein